jgi:hypothetical protein
MINYQPLGCNSWLVDVDYRSFFIYYKFYWVIVKIKFHNKKRVVRLYDIFLDLRSI